MFPGMNHQYTLISNSSENRSTSGGSDNSNPTSSLNIKRFCSVLSREVRNHAFDLKYSSRCSPAKNCTPLFASDLARVVSLKPIECLKDAKRLRFLVEFVDSSNVWYRRPFDPNTTLIGEGSWDAETNQLSCVACRFLDAAGSWNNTRVGDSSTRITLRFPAVWTIGKTSSMAREICSNKNVTELGYFEKIMFESPQDDIGRVLIYGVKYEYTKTKQVSNSSSTTPAEEFFQTFRRTLGVQPRGLTSSSKGSHQQLQGVSKVVSMASKGSCDPIDPTVDPPLTSSKEVSRSQARLIPLNLISVPKTWQYANE